MDINHLFNYISNDLMNMGKLFCFCFGFITMMYLVTLAISNEGAFGTPDFLDYNVYYAIWHGNYAHAWFWIRFVIATIFYCCLIAIIFKLGKSSNHNNNDNENGGAAGLSMV